MRRADAEKLVGRKVRAWTGLNGQYYGSVVRIHGSPWRAKVRVEAVLKVGNASDGVRMPYAEGLVIDVGGSSVDPWDRPPPGTWRETALRACDDLIRMFQGHSDDLAKVQAGQMRPYRHLGTGAQIHEQAVKVRERLAAGEPGRSWKDATVIQTRSTTL